MVEGEIQEPPHDSLPPLRDVARKHGLLAKKSLGQNFLFDLNLTRRIARGGCGTETKRRSLRTLLMSRP